MGRPRDVFSRLNVFSLTTVELDNVFERLSGESLTLFNIKAVQTAANSLKQDVRDLFLQRMPSAGRESRSGYNDVLLDAVRQQSNTGARARSNFQYGRTFVHILGINSSSSGTWRARFFEVGTRRNGKQAIKPLRMLADATKSFNMRLDVRDCLVKFISGINHTKGATHNI